MKKNGFTLIELLAVILILGIIALIAIPIVNKTIEESRKDVFNSSLNGLVKAVENNCVIEQNKNNELTKIYTISNGIMYPKVNIKGQLPDGTIKVDNNCGVTFDLHNTNFIGTKDTSNGKINIIKNDGSKNNQVLIEKNIDKSKSYVGYYADVDDNGTVDGVIFADLLTG